MRLLPRWIALAGLLATAWAASAADRAPGPAVTGLGTLQSPARPYSGEPCLGTTQDGGFYLSWIERVDSTRHALRVARWGRPGWSDPNTVAEGESLFVNGADVPDLLVLGNDKLVMSWSWLSGGDPYAYDVRVSGSMDGGRRWTAPITPHRDDTKTEHGFVSLIPAAEGSVRAFWLDGRKMAKKPEAGAHEDEGHGVMTLRTALVRLDGSLDAEEEVDNRVCDCCPIAAVGHGRGAVVAYRDRTLDDVRDVAVAWLDGTRWSDPAPVHTDRWKIKGCPVNGPAMDGNGDHLVVAWFTEAGDSAEVRVAFSGDKGRDFGDPVRVDQGKPMGRASVLMLDDGSALVGWLESRGPGAA